MALKEQYMLKCHKGAGDLELEEDPGESFLIKNVWIHKPATNYVTFKIEKAVVGFFRVGGVLGSHLPFVFGRCDHSHDILLDPTGITVAETVQMMNAGGVGGDPAMPLKTAIAAATRYRRRLQLSKSLVLNKTILDYLAEKEIFKGYPVASGQKFVISGAGQSGAIQLVQYEIYDEGDMTPDMENGSQATEYFFLNYGNTGANVNVTGDTIYNTPVSPPEFPDWPYAKDVPANYEIDLYGILGSDFCPKENDGTNYCYTNYLKLVRERITLFDEDRNGLLFEGYGTLAEGNMDMVGEGQSVIGNYSDVDCRPPWMLPAPLTFTEGEELGVYLTTTRGGTGQNIAVDEHEIALIEKVRRVA